MIFIQIFLLLVILVCCVLIQIFKGYYFFEWNVYFQSLFLYSLPSNILMCIFALFIQTISKNKYIGHFIIILYYMFLIWMPSFGLDHRLYLIGVLPDEIYSDMNKFGNSFFPFVTFTIYWGLFYFGIALLTILFWKRGEILTWKDRLTEFKSRIKLNHKILFLYQLFSCFFLLIQNKLSCT